MPNMPKNKSSPTVVNLVLDAVGIKTLEAALRNSDVRISLPNLEEMGLGNLLGNVLDDQYSLRIARNENANFAYAITQASAEPDSVVGHREQMGVVDQTRYELFYDGFSEEYIAALEDRIGVGVMYNKMAGGMEAIELNWREHRVTGCPIVYASKCDPLIQIAMDESVIPVERQHEIVDIAFKLAQEMGVGITRAIARPFIVSEEGMIARTKNRHDAVIPLKQRTLIDILTDNGIYTVAVGKAKDLVPSNYRHIESEVTLDELDPELDLQFVHPDKKDTNPYSSQKTVNAVITAKNVYRPNGTFIFSNLVDTDSLFGHTRDYNGALRSLQEIDKAIGIIKKLLGEGDILIVTADHGMEDRGDYGYHSIEPLPFLLQRIGHKGRITDLNPMNLRSLADVGYVISQVYRCQEQFLSECKLQCQEPPVK